MKTVEQLAGEYATAWVNGDYDHVVQELSHHQLPAGVAAAVAAHMLFSLGATPDFDKTTINFLRRLEYEANQQMEKDPLFFS